MSIIKPLVLASALSLPIASATEIVIDRTCLDAKKILDSGENFESFFIKLQHYILPVDKENNLAYYQGFPKLRCFKSSKYENLEVIVKTDGKLTFIVSEKK